MEQYTACLGAPKRQVIRSSACSFGPALALTGCTGAGLARDLLAASLLPRLDLHALQSLGHSCKALRALVAESLPVLLQV